MHFPKLKSWSLSPIRLCVISLLGIALLAIIIALQHYCPQENFQLHAMFYGVDMMIMASSFMLCIICTMDAAAVDTGTQVFLGILYLVFTNAFADVVSRMVDGNPFLIPINQLFTTITFLTTPLLAVFFWRYQATIHPTNGPIEKELGNMFLIFALVDAFCILINIPFGFLFSIDAAGYYTQGSGYWIARILPLLVLTTALITTITKVVPARQKFGLLSFTFIPLVFAISGAFTPQFDLEYAGSFLGLLMLYGMVQVERGVELVHQRELNMYRDQQLMISQIQPHFLYNTLASISSLCSKDPDLASEVTDKFADYLRMNMESIDRKQPIPFEKELEHVKTYLWIEQLRFRNRLHVWYDIQVSDFSLPALSIQPLVENAVKHGIFKKEGGGTVRLYTFESVTHYYVKVTDNGVGFDLSKVFDDGKNHVGISNVRSRLENMCNGRLLIESNPDAGTTATIMIPKE